jgi:tetratricopeptide (TPR) repeat protein
VGPLGGLSLVSLRRTDFQPHSAGVLEELNRRILRDLGQATQLEPAEPWIQFLVAESSMMLGKEAEALQGWKRALTLERPLHTWKGQRVYSDIQTRIDLAARYAYAAAMQEDGNPEAWALLATALLQLENGKAAKDWAGWLRRPDPGELPAWASGRALQIAPSHTQALAVRGTVALDRRQFDAALEDFRAALSQDPHNYLAAAGLARAYQGLARSEESLAAYTRLLELAPTEWHRLEDGLARARLLLDCGQTAEALASFNHVLRSAGTNAHRLAAHLWRARALAAQGKTEEARDALKEADGLDADAAQELGSRLFPGGE